MRNINDPSPRRHKVQSAGMAVAVLKALSSLGGAASLSALAAYLNESPAKMHRYLASLVEGGLVLQEADDARYVLGPEAISIGLAAMRQLDVLKLTSKEMAILAETHQLSCFVSVMGNHGPTIVRWDEPVLPVTVNVRVGSVMPVLWSATGRAFGAFSDSIALWQLIDEELARSTPTQRNLLPDRPSVNRLFQEIRNLRCAPIRDTLLNGVSAVSAPIFNSAGKVAAVLTAVGPTGGFDPTPGGNIAALVVHATEVLSARLGYRGTDIDADDQRSR